MLSRNIEVRMRLPRLLLTILCMQALPAHADSEHPNLSRLLPIIFYTPDTGFGGGGFLIKNLDTPASGDPSQLVAFAMVTQRRQVISIAEPKIYWDEGLWEWTGKILVQDFPSDFYGRGTQELPEKDAENYGDKRLGLETSLKNIFYQRFFWDLEIGAGWQRYALNHDDGPTPNVDAEFARWGRHGQQQFTTLSLGHDDRSSKVRATSGHLIQAFYRATRFQTDHGNDGFGLTGLDWKQYVPMSDRQSLALQLFGAEMDNVAVPFYLLQGIGGNQVLRGFYGNQFRDYAVAFAQSEWRTLWRKDWGFRIFAGVGAHAETLADLDQARGKTAGGIGFDYFLDTRSMNNLRLDFGFSEDNFGVYFLYGNAI